MGQRLVVTVQQKQEDIAKVYFHWSAYSISAVDEAKSLITALLENEHNIEDIRLRILAYLTSQGGGIDGGINSDEGKYFQKTFPDVTFEKKDINRSYGLLAISPSGMEDMQNWSEGDITIDLDEQKVYNSVFFTHESIEKYNKYCKDCEDDENLQDKKLTDFPSLSINPEEFSFDEIDTLLEELIVADQVDYVCVYDDTIYSLIA